ncbi:4-hydroxy-tetrahydrodipicolinate synthase [Brachybacterium sp. DNPG3]
MTSPYTSAVRPFGAVGTAMVTPLTEDASGIDLAASAALAVHLVEHGNDLLVLSGTTGEAPTVSLDEKIALVCTVREAVGQDVTLVAGVGTYDTARTVELARAHADLPIDGLLVVTPYYSKPSQAGILAHLRTVADATDLPVMLYDIPGRTGVPLSEDTILRIAEHERVLAVKDAKGDLLQSTRIMSATDLAYYCGEDALNLPWLALGAAGLVSVVGHVAGDLEKEMLDAVDRGDLATARAANARLAPLVDAVMGGLPGAVAAKAALYLQGVLPHAAVRAPQLAADDEQLRALADALAVAEGVPALDPSRRP